MQLRPTVAVVSLLLSAAVFSHATESGIRDPGSAHQELVSPGSRIETGEAFDVAILTSPLIGELVTSGRLTAASRTDLARSGVSMAIHPLATKPDITAADALKGALEVTLGRSKGQGPSLAGDRLPAIPAAQMTPAQQQAVADFKTARGVAVTGPFHPLLRSPELMTRTRAMGDYLRYKSALPPRLSEFVILMTARAWTQQYEWNAHYPIAIKAGLRPEVAQAVAEGRRPVAMAADEAALYDFCQELHRDKSVSDATYSRAVAAFGEQAVVDAIGISGYYTMLAMVLNTARTPAGDSTAPVLRPLPR